MLHENTADERSGRGTGRDDRGRDGEPCSPGVRGRGSGAIMRFLVQCFQVTTESILHPPLSVWGLHRFSSVRMQRSCSDIDVYSCPTTYQTLLALHVAVQTNCASEARLVRMHQCQLRVFKRY